jgi:hypothetical protein
MIDFTPSSALEHAVRQARRIRRNLVRLRGDNELGGDCGLASLLLADALGSTRSLRYTDNASYRHVWHVVDGAIIDITATQFNAPFEANEDTGAPVFGVLVTRKPRSYHRPVVGWGRAALHYVDWYDDQDHRRLRAVIERLRRV